MSKKSKPKRPTRDDFELEELAERLIEAKDEQYSVYLDVWNQGERVSGLIVNLDSRTKLVHVKRDGEITKVPFMDIMRVNNV